MIIFKTTESLSGFIQKTKAAQKTIGFVPTMGALHEGHISLITASRKENHITISSIFVNPTQFNNPSDFEKYPITIEADIDKLEASGCDILFLPPVSEIYSTGYRPMIYELGYLETILEGSFRPGHYQGVCQVVDRLLTIVGPHILYLGQKDYQQCMVIQKMIGLRNLDTIIHIEKTIREKDGLAMSSRNMRLNVAEREQALKIFETLSLMKRGLKTGDLLHIKKAANDFLSSNGFKVDYTEIATASSLQLMDKWDGKTALVLLVAAYLNEVRLIDNFVVEATFKV